MPILERVKNTVRIIRKCVHVVVFSLGVTVVVVVAGLSIYTANRSPLSPQEQSVRHEFQIQAFELQHRTDVCNSMIDGMIPGYTNGAAVHCALMWRQMKMFEAFAGQMHISDPSIRPLVEGSFRAAARYAEYQKAIDRPQYQPSNPNE